MEFVLKDLQTDIPKHDGDILKLYKAVKQQLSLHASKDLSDSLKQILSGLISIVTGLGGISNQLSDRHVRRYKPAQYHAELAVNASLTFSKFLIGALERKKAEIQ